MKSYNSLQNASNLLQGIQDSLINKSEQNLVDALSASNSQLTALSQQVNDEVNRIGQNIDRYTESHQCHRWAYKCYCSCIVKLKR